MKQQYQTYCEDCEKTRQELSEVSLGVLRTYNAKNLYCAKHFEESIRNDLTPKPQTIEEIVKEFNRLGNTEFFYENKEAPQGHLLYTGSRGEDPIEYPESKYELDQERIANWLRTKLQSLQDEKAEIIREVDKLFEHPYFEELGELRHEIKAIAQKYGVDISK